MPRHTDPAPCAEGEDLYECTECRTRLCSGETIASCPNCGAVMENLSKPRVQ